MRARGALVYGAFFAFRCGWMLKQKSQVPPRGSHSLLAVHRAEVASTSHKLKQA